MYRRDLLFAGATLPLVSGLGSVPAVAAGRIQVVYVGGWDCPYCTVWKNEYKKSWVESPYYKQVEWTEVDIPHLREAYRQEHWKGELESIREQLPKKSGTPRFIVVRDGKVVSNELGVNKWEDTLTRIRTLLV